MRTRIGSRLARLAVGFALLIVAQVSIATLPAKSSAAQTATPVAEPSATIWWDDAVCYEIFVRSFSDSDGDGIGDLNGLTSKLDYLNDADSATTDDLGVTCVWLMPIFPSPSYHGYDVTDYGTVNPDYGTLTDFENFLAGAHRRGIRILLDLPLNHTSVDHPWFQEARRDPTSPYRDWYIFSPADPGYPGPWGEQVWHRSPDRDEYYYGIFWEGMPDLNYRNPAVTAAAFQIADAWLDRGVDGFRLDAIKHLIEDGTVQENTLETHEWLHDYRQYLDQEHPDSLMIGEVFGAGASILEPFYDPPQLQTYFQFELAGQLLNAATSGNGDSLVYTVADALQRQPSQPFGVFLTNHDQTRAMTILSGDLEAAKLAAAAMLTLPGLPFIYYGEEIGMRGEKPDERLRTPMQWSGDSGGGFTSGQPWESFQNDLSTVNVATQDDDPYSLLNLYRRLIHLHTAHPALAHGTFIPLTSSERSITAYLRVADDDIVLVILNYGDEPAARPTFEIDPSLIAAGEYLPNTLLGGVPVLSLTVADDGSIALSPGNLTVPANATWIFQLETTTER